MSKNPYKSVNRQKFLEGDTEELKKLFANLTYLLKLKREQRGFTQLRAAEIIGISINFYGECERGEKFMGGDHLIKTILLFQIELHELFGEAKKRSKDIHPIHILIAQLDKKSKDILYKFIANFIYKK